MKCHCQLFNQSYGHFYKNPPRNKEIQCAVGFGIGNNQIYPKLKLWMEEIVAAKQFSQLIQFLEKEFNETPISLSITKRMWAFLLVS